MKSSDEATKIAKEYLSLFLKQNPLLVKLANGVWIVKIDVGEPEPKIIEVEVDAETGEIIRCC